MIFIKLSVKDKKIPEKRKYLDKRDRKGSTLHA